MQHLYSSCSNRVRSGLRTVWAGLLLLCLLCSGQAAGQTVIFSEDFESAPSGTTLLPAVGWDLYTATTGNSRWAVGSASCVISGSKSLYVARNTTANPCDYAPGSSTDRIAYKSFPTTNFNNLKLSFKWRCNGEVFDLGSWIFYYDYGRVCYSLNGTTWTDLPAYYYDQTSTQIVTNLSLPAALNNKATVYLGFRWVNDDLDKYIPGFVVDDIVVTGIPMAPPAPTPVITALSAASGCAGSALTITGTDLGSATSVTIGGTAATIVSNTATSISVTVGAGTTGNVVVTTAGGASNGLPFTINPIPVGTATPATANICSGGATSIVLSSSATGTNYTWTAAQLSGGSVTGFADCATGCAGTIAQTLSVSGSNPGVVRYTITPEANGCTGTAFTADVTVNPAPTGTAMPATATICSGAATSIVLNGSVTGTTYTWTAAQLSGGAITGFSDCTSGCAGTIAQTLNNAGTTAGTMRYTITPSVGGCAGTSFTADVTVNPAPAGTATPVNATLCSGESTGIVLSTTMSGATYTWTAAQISGGTITGFADCATGCAGTIAQALTATDVTLGTVRYTITPTAGGCSGAAFTADAVVQPNPPVTATPATSNICSGTTTNIALSTGVAAATFAWPAPTVTGGTVTGAVAGTGNTISQTLTNTGSTPATVTYTITATNGSGANTCTTAPITATVIVSPGVEITVQPTGNTQCGGSFTFAVTAINATGYQWYGPGGIIPGASASTYTINNATASNSGDYYVVVSGPAGCPDITSDNATLTVSDPATISVQPLSVEACEGTPLTLSVMGSGALSYQWYKDGAPISGATAAIYAIAAPTPADNGSYYVTLTPGAPCPELISYTATVTVFPTGAWYGFTDDWNDANNWCGGVPTATTDVVLPPSGSVPFDAHIRTNKLGEANSITLQGGTLTLDNGGTLQLFGNLNLEGGGTFDGASGTLRLSGSADQQLQPEFSVNTLMVEGGGNKHLNNDLTVHNFLVLGSGNVVLNGHVLRLSPGANIFGISPASYVVTNGGGLQQVVGTAAYIFPVGVSSYNPVYMTNAGTKDTFLVRVREEVLENGSSGAPINPTVSTVILRTWDITESVPGGSNGTITLQWNAGEENNPEFSYEHAYMAQYTANGWVNTCCSDPDSAGAAVGAGPYTRTRSGITEFTHFTVASAAGESPLVVSALNDNAFDMRAFPNPVNEVLTVVITNPGAQSRVSLTDVAGRELAAHFASNGKVTFDMRSLAQGMYFVKYADGKQSRMIKVSKR